MPYIEAEVIMQAKQMDLLTYLQNYEPQELIHVSGNIYCTKAHDSLRISNGKWCWFSHGIGGKSALDYLIKVNGYAFTEAVEKIMGRAAVKPPVFMSDQKEKSKKLLLPPANDNADKVISYLKSRGIYDELIYFCLNTRRLYESSFHNNAVFVGFDKDNIPRYATIRGTGNARFMGEANGSDKHYSFAIPAESSDNTVHLFESAVDLLSYATLYQQNGKPWRDKNLLSLAGIYQPKKVIEESKIPAALTRFLEDYPHIKNITLHLDNDYAGRMATKAIMTVMPKEYTVSSKPPPKGKDYNDYLCLLLKQRERNHAR